jgi:lipoprotein signal peptidase
MKIVVVLILFTQIGCSTIVEVGLNAMGGALGNIIDRRIDEEHIEKEKDNECKDCEDDKR